MPRAIRITSASGALTVNLTGPSGATPVVYTDSGFTTTTSLPATVTSGGTSTFWLQSPGAYSLSVKTSTGTEIASDNNSPRTVDLETSGTIAALTYDTRFTHRIEGDSGRGSDTGDTNAASLSSLGRVKTAAAPIMRPANRMLTRKFSAVRPLMTATNSPTPTAYSTTVYSTVASGVSALNFPAIFRVGQTLTVDTAGAQETVTVTGVSGTGPYWVHTLAAPTTQPHTAGAVVTGTNDWSPTLTGNFITPGSPFTIYGGIAYAITGNGVTTSDPHSVLWQPKMTVEFVTDAPLLAMWMASAGTNVIEIAVNDEVIYFGQVPSGGSWQQLDWGGVRTVRRYRIRGIYTFKTLRVGAPDTVQSAVEDYRPTCAVIADSFGQGNGAGGIENLGGVICELMGWRGMHSAEGGTGYSLPVATGTGTENFKVRAADIIAAQPDIVLSIGGHNDPIGTVQADATTFWQSIKAGLPNARCFATSALAQHAKAQLVYGPSQVAIAAACAATGVTYVPIADVILGTGNLAAPAGDGPADIQVNTDDTHPASTGDDWLAMAIANALTGAL